MTTTDPEPGTIRYLCPLECGWNHDVPPVSIERFAELSAAIDPAALDPSNPINSFARQAYVAEARQTDAAAREHLATHTTEQFVQTIHGLRVELAAKDDRVAAIAHQLAEKQRADAALREIEGETELAAYGRELASLIDPGGPSDG